MRRHDFDLISLAFGLAFTGLGVVMLSGRIHILVALRWAWPVVLLALGVAVALGARDGRPRPAAEPGEPAVDEELDHS